MNGPGDEAADLLIFYMRRAWEAAGLGWDPDNSAEMRNLVDRLGDAAEDKADSAVAIHSDNSPHLYADGSMS